MPGAHEQVLAAVPEDEDSEDSATAPAAVPADNVLAELAALRAENARLEAAYEQTLLQLAAWMEQVNALQQQIEAFEGYMR
jgi:hypothetical protein